MSALFRDRQQAGRLLASRLWRYSHRPDVIVLGLPRGGVPVAVEVATALGVPLDLFTVRKLGVPGESELALGAIAPGGVTVLNEDVIREMGIQPEVTEAVAAREEQTLARRDRTYRGGRPEPELAGRIAILVDDGIVTGTSARAAAGAIRRLCPTKLVLAAPVVSSEARDAVAAEVDELVLVAEPEPFHSLGIWYDHFPHVTDDEIRELLDRAAVRAGTGEPTGPQPA